MLSPIEKIVEEREAERNKELMLEKSKETSGPAPPMIKIPSQKLSTLIKRKNTKRRIELKK